MKEHRITYYWACEACGASPIPAKNMYRYFATESEAQNAGKPERCSNQYCHGLDRNSSPIQDKIKVHSITEYR